MISNIYFYIGLIALIIGSITDLKKREVPDWINFGLIFFGLIFASILSIKNMSIIPITRSILGLIIAFLIAAIMFYTGQWGGGDAKMLMGLGALFGVTLSLKNILSDKFINFNFNILIAGAFYGILWSVYLAIKHLPEFKSKVKELNSQKNFQILKKISMFASIILIICSFIFQNLRMSLLGLAILILITYYLWIYIKSIEEACMIKKMKPKELTEGDWILNSIRLGGKTLIAKKKINVSDINKIKEYEEKVNPKINIRRKILFIPTWKNIPLSKLKIGDELTNNLINYGVKNKKIKESDFNNLQTYLRKNKLHKVKVKVKNRELIMNPLNIKEGHLLLEPIKKEEFLVCGPEDLGIEKYQIEQLKQLYKQKKLKEIMVKEGIPFIPSFLLAYLMTFFLPSILSILTQI